MACIRSPVDREFNEPVFSAAGPWASQRAPGRGPDLGPHRRARGNRYAGAFRRRPRDSGRSPPSPERDRTRLMTGAGVARSARRQGRELLDDRGGRPGGPSSWDHSGGSGAGDGIRTRDILLGKQALCQLSYSRSGVARVYRRAQRASTEAALEAERMTERAVACGRQPALGSLIAPSARPLTRGTSATGPADLGTRGSRRGHRRTTTSGRYCSRRRTSRGTCDPSSRSGGAEGQRRRPRGQTRVSRGDRPAGDLRLRSPACGARGPGTPAPPGFGTLQRARPARA